MTTTPSTLGALRKSPWGVPERARRSVKEEMRHNLLTKLCANEPLFELSLIHI